jgi:glutamate synthase (NADH)
MGDISAPRNSQRQRVAVYKDPVDTSSLSDEVEEEASVFNYQETTQNKSWASSLPLKQGLYDPALEKDACGVGFSA